MVGIASDEGTAAEGTVGITLVGALLVGHERPFENVAVISVLAYGLEFERAFGSIEQIVVDKLQVINAPHTLICQGAEAVLEHGDVGAEEICGSHVFGFFLATVPDCHAVVGGIVIHVAHSDYLDAGELLHQGHGLAVEYLASTTAQVRPLAADPRRQVGHKKGEHLAGYGTPHHKDVTGAEVILLLLVEGEFHLAALKCERYALGLEDSILIKLE